MQPNDARANRASSPRRYAIVSSSFVLAWALTGTLGGCSGSLSSDLLGPPQEVDTSTNLPSESEALGPDAEDVGGSVTATSDDEDAGTEHPRTAPDAGSSNDGSTGNDAGPQGGDLSTPGRIRCGAAMCGLGSQACCHGMTKTECIGADSLCLGVKLSCDEHADCPTGQRCCLSPGNFIPSIRGRAECANSCDSDALVLCNTDEECGASGACTEKTCFDHRFRSCGPAPQHCD